MHIHNAGAEVTKDEHAESGFRYPLRRTSRAGESAGVGGDMGVPDLDSERGYKCVMCGVVKGNGSGARVRLLRGLVVDGSTGSVDVGGVNGFFYSRFFVNINSAPCARQCWCFIMCRGMKI